MKFIISRDVLLPCLQTVNGVIERRHTLPVLSNLLMSVGKSQVKLTGTDMEVELIVTFPFECDQEAEFTLPARKMLDICRALPDASILDVTTDKDRVTLKSNKSRFTLATLPAKEFPLTEISSFQATLTISQGELKNLLEDTMFAMAQQDVRYYLNGLLLEVNANTLRAVATDGHRLALKEVKRDTGINEQKQVIIPRKGVIEISRLLGSSDKPAEIMIGTNHIRVNIDGLQFTSKLIDGKFPDYERVIPKDTGTPLYANKEALRLSLTRASILSNEKYRGVRIQLKPNSLKALTHNPDQEEAEEELEVKYSGEEMEIGFNVTYLLDAINAIKTEQIIMTAASPDSSCLLTPEDQEDCKYVVMPMRL